MDLGQRPTFEENLSKLKFGLNPWNRIKDQILHWYWDFRSRPARYYPTLPAKDVIKIAIFQLHYINELELPQPEVFFSFNNNSVQFEWDFIHDGKAYYFDVEMEGTYDEFLESVICVGETLKMDNIKTAERIHNKNNVTDMLTEFLKKFDTE